MLGFRKLPSACDIDGKPMNGGAYMVDPENAQKLTAMCVDCFAVFFRATMNGVIAGISGSRPNE